MWLKIVGIGVVLVASWGYGSGLIRILNWRKQQMTGLLEVIDLFIGEIVYGKLPLQDASEQIACRMEQPYKTPLLAIGNQISQKKYQSFEDVWTVEFKNAKDQFHLIPKEQEVLFKVGKYLGYLDTEAQVRHLQMCKNEANQLLEQLNGTMKEKKKVYRSVSLMVGAMIILLFV